MHFEYEIRVPGSANTTEDGWAKPSKSGSMPWDSTAHSLGRHLLALWLEEATGEHAGLPALVEVRGEDGSAADIIDPSPVSEAVAALEQAIETKQAADIAAAIAGDALAEAMRDVVTFDRRSKNNVAHRVRSVMSRPTALGLLKG